MDERQTKVRIRSDRLNWIKNNYCSTNEGVNDCIDRCMRDRTNDRKRILDGMMILAEAVQKLSVKYPTIDFSDMQKGVDLICQTSSHSED